MPLHRRHLLLAALALLVGASPSAHAADRGVLVFAAASLRNALDDAVARYRGQGGGPVKVSYAASSTLARQIENGAPADLFISADLQWMDYLEKRHLIQPATRGDLVGNRLVLVAPADSTLTVDIRPGFPLARLLGDGRLAMADPDSVPAGLYGKAALQSLGVWESVEGRIVRAENVRAALFFVDRGEAPLGIVYATDAHADRNVRIAGTFPADSHPPIVYPAALTSAGRNPAAVRFLAFLRSPAARPAFTAQGFTVLE